MDYKKIHVTNMEHLIKIFTVQIFHKSKTKSSPFYMTYRIKL